MRSDIRLYFWMEMVSYSVYTSTIHWWETQRDPLRKMARRFVCYIGLCLCVIFHVFAYSTHQTFLRYVLNHLRHLNWRAISSTYSTMMVLIKCRHHHRHPHCHRPHPCWLRPREGEEYVHHWRTVKMVKMKPVFRSAYASIKNKLLSCRTCNRYFCTLLGLSFVFSKHETEFTSGRGWNGRGHYPSSRVKWRTCWQQSERNVTSS